jgi:hypothetical protein
VALSVEWAAYHLVPATGHEQIWVSASSLLAPIRGFLHEHFKASRPRMPSPHRPALKREGIFAHLSIFGDILTSDRVYRHLPSQCQLLQTSGANQGREIPTRNQVPAPLIAKTHPYCSIGEPAKFIIRHAGRSVSRRESRGEGAAKEFRESFTAWVSRRGVWKRSASAKAGRARHYKARSRL